MARSRLFWRVFLVCFLLAGLLAAAILPALAPAKAAPNLQATVAAPDDVVISEFRFIGSNGEGDEFVELFNRNCSTTFDLSTWSIRVSDGSTETARTLTFLSSTLLAPRQYFLLALAGPTYDDSVSADATYSPGIVSATGGVALLDSSNAMIDKVGVNPDALHEGAPLPPLGDSVDQSYERDQDASNMYVDTDNNLTDFSGPLPSHPPRTGACGAGVPTATPTSTSTATSTATSTSTATPTDTVPPPDTATPTATPTATLSCGSSPYPALSVIINEVAWAGTLYSPSDEWIELYNPSSSCTIDLNGWKLEGTSAGLLRFSVDFDSSDSIGPRAYFVITDDPTDHHDVFTDTVTVNKVADLTLQNTGESLVLSDPQEVLVDHANFTTTGSASWPAGSAFTLASMERYRPTTDVRSNWVTWANPITPPSPPRDHGNNLVRGTPGRANWALAVTVTPSPVPTKLKPATPRPPTPFAHMVINEFLPRAGTDWNQDGSVNVFDEFIEVKNLGPINVDLAGWKLDDDVNVGSLPYTLPSVKLKPDERAVFYGSETHILLDDSGDSVRLINPRGIVIDVRTYGPVADPDVSHCRIPDGYYWRQACFPTPGNENSLTGSSPAPPPSAALHPPPCLLADTVPKPFREAECSGFGADIWDPTYWDDPAGLRQFPAQDAYNKWKTIVQ